MGASASLTAKEAYVTRAEVEAAAGSQWDEGKWDAAEKDGEGRVQWASVGFSRAASVF